MFTFLEGTFVSSMVISFAYFDSVAKPNKIIGFVLASLTVITTIYLFYFCFNNPELMRIEPENLCPFIFVSSVVAFSIYELNEP